jgi:hypothetical protein
LYAPAILDSYGYVSAASRSNSNTFKGSFKMEPLRKVRKSTEEVLNPAVETVSSTPNKGCVLSAQPVIDAADCGTGHWEGNGQDLRFVTNQSIPSPQPFKGYGTLAGDNSKYQESSQKAVAKLSPLSREAEQQSARTRKANPAVTLGSHTTSDTTPTQGEPGAGRESAEREKEIRFGRNRELDVRHPAGDAKKFPRRGMSGRDFNETNAPAPNREKK